MSDTNSDTSDSDHETARAAKRMDRGVEENHEVFSNVDFLSILGLFETTGIDCQIAPIYVSKKSVK